MITAEDNNKAFSSINIVDILFLFAIVLLPLPVPPIVAKVYKFTTLVFYLPTICLCLCRSSTTVVLYSAVNPVCPIYSIFSGM